MQMHAYAPHKVPAPELYCKLSWVKELGVTWDELGGIAPEELSLLAEMLNIHGEAQALKGRVARGGR